MKNKSLSHREKEVLLFLACGLTEKEVASKLHRSLHTIHTHRKNIFKKLKTHCLIVAVAKALYQKHLAPHEWFFALTTNHLL